MTEKKYIQLSPLDLNTLLLLSKDTAAANTPAATLTDNGTHCGRASVCYRLLWLCLQQWAGWVAPLWGLRGGCAAPTYPSASRGCC